LLDYKKHKFIINILLGLLIGATLVTELSATRSQEDKREAVVIKEYNEHLITGFSKRYFDVQFNDGLITRIEVSKLIPFNSGARAIIKLSHSLILDRDLYSFDTYVDQ